MIAGLPMQTEGIRVLKPYAARCHCLRVYLPTQTSHSTCALSRGMLTPRMHWPDRYLAQFLIYSPAGGAGTLASSLSIATAKVRFICDTTPGTERWEIDPASETVLLQTVAPVLTLTI